MKGLYLSIYITSEKGKNGFVDKKYEEVVDLTK